MKVKVKKGHSKQFSIISRRKLTQCTLVQTQGKYFSRKEIINMQKYFFDNEDRMKKCEEWMG